MPTVHRHWRQQTNEATRSKAEWVPPPPLCVSEPLKAARGGGFRFKHWAKYESRCHLLAHAPWHPVAFSRIGRNGSLWPSVQVLAQVEGRGRH